VAPTQVPDALPPEPGTQHVNLPALGPGQQIVPGLQHFEGPPLQGEQTWPLAQHVVLLAQQTWFCGQQALPQGVVPGLQVAKGCGPPAGAPKARETLPKPNEASAAPPTAPLTSLNACRRGIGRAMIREISSKRLLISLLQSTPPCSTYNGGPFQGMLQPPLQPSRATSNIASFPTATSLAITPSSPIRKATGVAKIPYSFESFHFS
jgi:hypothetical protein